MRARAGRGLVGLVREAKDPNPKKNIEPEHYSKPATLCVCVWTQELRETFGADQSKELCSWPGRQRANSLINTCSKRTSVCV